MFSRVRERVHRERACSALFIFFPKRISRGTPFPENYIYKKVKTSLGKENIFVLLIPVELRKIAFQGRD